MNAKPKKNVGDNISVENASWTFGGEVANTFSQHVRRSVPLYEAGQLSNIGCVYEGRFGHRGGFTFFSVVGDPGDGGVPWHVQFDKGP